MQTSYISTLLCTVFILTIVIKTLFTTTAMHVSYCVTGSMHKTEGVELLLILCFNYLVMRYKLHKE